jgi:hypothetical protein
LKSRESHRIERALVRIRGSRFSCWKKEGGLDYNPRSRKNKISEDRIALALLTRELILTRMKWALPQQPKTYRLLKMTMHTLIATLSHHCPFLTLQVTTIFESEPSATSPNTHWTSSVEMCILRSHHYRRAFDVCRSCSRSKHSVHAPHSESFESFLSLPAACAMLLLTSSCLLHGAE